MRHAATIKPASALSPAARRDSVRELQFALEASRGRYAHLYDFAPVGYVSLSRSGLIAEINLTATTLLGRTRAELVGHPFAVFVDRADVPTFLEHLRRCRESASRVTTELNLRRIHGGIRPVQLISVRLPGLPRSGLVLFHTALMDLTEQRQLEESRRLSEERLQLALRGAQAGAWDVDLVTGEASWSDEFARLLGLDPRQGGVSCARLRECLHPLDRALLDRALLDRALLDVADERMNFRIEVRVPLAGRGVRWLALSGRVSREEAGGLRLAGIGIDITGLKRAEEVLRRSRDTLERRVRKRTAALQQANTELQRQIAERKLLEQQLLEISERERRRIGRDLHDSLGQQLTGMVFLNNVLHEALVQKSLPEAMAAGRLGQLLELVKSKVRHLAHGLHPVFPEPQGLMSSLQQLAETVGQLHGINCRFDCPQPVMVADDGAATNLFRIAQEAINNAIQHGHAREITLALTSHNGTIQLEIRNNGRAWRGQRPKKPGLGMQIMKYRTELMGGVLEVRPAPGRGVVVSCSVPAPRRETGKGRS
ncbi:MAG: PAS domain S-box protein [Verrucomicrobiota bacterium]